LESKNHREYKANEAEKTQHGLRYSGVSGALLRDKIIFLTLLAGAFAGLAGWGLFEFYSADNINRKRIGLAVFLLCGGSGFGLLLWCLRYAEAIAKASAPVARIVRKQRRATVLSLMLAEPVPRLRDSGNWLLG
jgi:hypothetical protein